jgi:nitroreductase
MDAIFRRRSIRHYTDRPVEKEKITQILKAAMAAPSACNQQPWRFYVVTDRETIATLAAVSPYSTFAASAPVLIVPAFRTDCELPEFAPIDLSAAVENLWVETAAQGLGGVWMGVYPRTERMAKIAAILKMPPQEKPFAMFSLGYAAREKPPACRYHEDWVRYIE